MSITREKAAQILQETYKYASNYDAVDISKAFDMAIEALSADEQIQIAELVRCKDCRFAMVRTEEEMNKPIKPQPILCEWLCIGVENDAYCSHGERREPTIPMFTESEEAYKDWTGEEMGGDEIDEMNREIIKDILKTIPTAYLLEALGVATFEELMESADRPKGETVFRTPEELRCLSGR